MCLAVDGLRLALALPEKIVVFARISTPGEDCPPALGQFNALFVPTAIYLCGQLDIHELGWHKNTLWAINTRFSCLCQLDHTFSFSPHWQPPFLSGLLPGDRCHLNGLALAEGEPLYVTALGATGTPQGWRKNMMTGGILMHVPSGEIILRNLPMPHSPRLYEGQLYLLHSAVGELVQVDAANGTFETVARLPGFLRGLSGFKDYLFIGLSQLRRGHPLTESLLVERELFSGIAVVHGPSTARHKSFSSLLCKYKRDNICLTT